MPKHQDPEGIEIKTVLKHLSFDDKVVLEIGCGDGRLTFKYSGMARKVVAVDPITDSIGIATRNKPKNLAGKVEFQVGHGEKLVFPAESFDIVFFTWSLCCTDIPMMEKALDEAWRVLRRDGILVNLQPSLHQPFSNGRVSYLVQKKFGTSVDDERYRQARLALKYDALIEGKFKLSAEEEFTVKTYYDTADETLEDVTRDRREQYNKLDHATKEKVREIIASLQIEDEFLTQENAVLTVLHKA